MNRPSLVGLLVLISSSGILADDPAYLEIQQTFSPVDHRWPMINNNGEFVYCQQVNGMWQVFSSTRGQLTSAGGDYTDALSPAVADDGSFICYRHFANSSLGCVLKYPGPSVVEFSSTNELSGAYREAGDHPSMASNGTAIWWYYFYPGIWGGEDTRRLFVSGRGQVSSGSYWDGDYPDVNADGKYVYLIGNQIHAEGRGVIATGANPHIGDAPQDNPDIVYVNGTQLQSTVMGIIGSGSWVDVNKNGIVVFERLVDGHYQIFEGYPLPRIISTPGAIALTGFPYKYDSDNTAEAYGASDPEDFYGGGPITWSIVQDPQPPPGFTIDSTTGKIGWIPSDEGIYSVTIQAENLYGTDEQTITITVSNATMELVDAVDFQDAGVLPSAADSYFAGGQPRIGVVADGASRLVVRAALEGVDLSDSTLNLHFDLVGVGAGLNMP